MGKDSTDLIIIAENEIVEQGEEDIDQNLEQDPLTAITDDFEKKCLDALRSAVVINKLESLGNLYSPFKDVLGIDLFKLISRGVLTEEEITKLIEFNKNKDFAKQISKYVLKDVLLILPALLAIYSNPEDIIIAFLVGYMVVVQAVLGAFYSEDSKKLRKLLLLRKIFAVLNSTGEELINFLGKCDLNEQIKIWSDFVTCGFRKTIIQIKEKIRVRLKIIRDSDRSNQAEDLKNTLDKIIKLEGILIDKVNKIKKLYEELHKSPKEENLIVEMENAGELIFQIQELSKIMTNIDFSPMGLLEE
jgi:hypothetical protein